VISRLGWICRHVANSLMAIAGIFLVLMMLQTVADVISANLFGRPIEGNIEIVSVYYMVMVVFLPLAWVEMKDEHIYADLFTNRLGRLPRRWVLGFSYVVAALFCAILAYQTAMDAKEAFDKSEVMMGSTLITIWPARFGLPIGFSAITLVLVLKFCEVIIGKPEASDYKSTYEDVE